MKSLNQIILDRTNAWAGKHGYKGYEKFGKSIEKSEKVIKIENFLKAENFGGRANQIAQILSLALGEKIEVSSLDFLKI